MEQQQPHPTAATPKKSYDFVIVGAGPSAMGLIYGLLSPYQSSSPPPFSIAVIERGSGPPHARTTVSPSAWFTASHEPSSSVQLLSSTLRLPPHLSYGRVMNVPTGRGLGGSTNIHACLCTPPSREDFVSWPKPWRDEMMESVHQVQDILQANDALQYDTNNSNLLVRLPPSRVEPDDDENDNEIDNDENNDKDNDDDPMPLVETFPWRETCFPSLVTSIPLTARKKTTNGGRTFMERINYHDALVVPLLQSNPHLQQHVHWYSSIQVERLIWEEDRVMGVECSRSTSSTRASKQDDDDKESDFFIVLASQQVILCAGALETPALLWVSGIGPQEELVKAGIPVRHSVEHVGHNLCDHIMIPRSMFTTSSWLRTSSSSSSASSSLSANGVAALAHARLGSSKFQLLVMDATSYTTVVPHMVAGLLWRDFTCGAAATAAGSTAFVLHHLANVLSRWLFRLVRFLLWLSVAYTPLYFVLRYFSVAVNLVLLNPSSRGTVKVVRRTTPSSSSSSNEDKEPPLRRCHVDVQVQLNYLSDPKDVDALQEGWQSLNERFCQDWFPNSLELFPGILYRGAATTTTTPDEDTPQSSSWFPSFANDNCLPYFHWCGTCAMPMEHHHHHYHHDSPPSAVVDARLRVLPSLRICDASVFPSTISGPTAMTCAALGLRFGNMLLEETTLGTTKKLD